MLQRCIQQNRCVLPTDRHRFHVLQNNQVRGCNIQLFEFHAALEQGAGVGGGGEEVGPERHFGLAGALDDRGQVDGELLNELEHAGQQGVRDGLFAGGLLLEHFVQQQFQRMGEVRQSSAAAGDLPGVEPQVASNQLPEDVVEVDLAVAFQHAERHLSQSIARSTGGIVKRFRFHAEENGFFEEHRQRVDVQLEGQHNPLGHERVTFISFTWI